MKALALSLLLIMLALQYRLWISDSGMREVWRLRREVTAQASQNDTLKGRNRTLAAEVQDLKKGKSAIEERARTDLGMVGANETFFQVAPKSGTAVAAPLVAETPPANTADSQAVHNPANAKSPVTANNGLGLSAAH